MKVTIEDIEKMRELRKKGYTEDQIAKETGHSKTTIHKYLSLTDEEFRKLKAEMIKRKAKEKLPTTTATIRTAVEEGIKDRATLDYVKVLELGEWVRNNITPISEKLRIKEQDLIKIFMLFYVKNYDKINKINKLEAELESYKNLVKKLLRFFVYPETLRSRKLEELKSILLMYLQNKMNPPNEIYQQILKLVGG
jgi:transcriptional regulator with XRE-family HTH domain